MSVTAPPGSSDHEREHELRETVAREQALIEEALREQALIEEARRRARRRRRRYAVVLLLGLAVAAVLGFGRAGGEQEGKPAAPASPTTGGGWGAGGGRIAVADGSRTLEVVNPDGDGVQAITCPAAVVLCGFLQPAWSPDSARLAFLRGRPYRPFESAAAMSVYVMSDARAARRLAACGICGTQYGSGLEWSPDGAEIVFSRDMPGAGRHQSVLWIVDTRTGRLRQLTDCGSNCWDVHPNWSPDGGLIIFTRFSRGGASLYTVHPDGSGLRDLDTPGAQHPVWSPDGRRIAFQTADRVFVAAADGSHRKLIVDGARGSGPGVPAWSPDGTRLAYLYTPGTPGRFTAEVWTSNADGSDKRRLYHSACCVSTWAAPIWSPDGQQIAFAASSAGGTHIINSDGSGLHRLTTVAAYALAWQRKP